MSGNPRHADFKRGERLARELHQFVERESADADAAAQALLGAFDYLDRRTRALRDPDVRWPDAARPRRDLI